MAVIKEKPELSPLNALTTAALVLPGLLLPLAHAAEGDEVDFQYSHYQEGKRDIDAILLDQQTGNASLKGIKSFNPIEVDTLHGHGNFSLTDRIKFAFNYTQDTWAGATPVSSGPAAFGLNNPVYNEDGTILVGATPYVVGGVAFDAKLNPYINPNLLVDPDTGESRYVKNNKLTHVMSYASPETRKQGDFKLTYEWDEMALSAGGGISIENDYESRFGNLGTRWDFNQKNTTVNLDLSYTDSTTNAVLDHDSYVSVANARVGQLEINKQLGYAKIIHGNRQDWATHLGLSQVLSNNAVVGADFSYTRSTGYMANPYKGVGFVFIDPDKQDFAPPNGLSGSLYTFLEQRPEVRNQWNLGGRYVQYINPLDAAIHFDYRFSADDWGIQAHTFEADWVQPLPSGWTVTPRVRYYSQDAADFYTPWLATFQSYKFNTPLGKLPYDPRKVFDPNNRTGNFSNYYSSDHRLSGYGALSGGVTIAKQFAKGITLETGFEYYTHQGRLKLVGGGEGAYADFDYWLANAALKVNLEALALGRGSDNHAAHHNHHNHGVHAPAGVMFDHMLPKAGDVMVGYRYMWNNQSGTMLNGVHAAADPTIAASGCGGDPCYLAPGSMSMSMHMLDLMYAPTDWLTLMLMPQFMDMDMSMRQLAGGSSTENLGNEGQHISHHIQNGHETGGIGDLGMYALFKLLDNGVHHVQATAGLSAPTGDVNIKLRRNHGIEGGFIHYGMQLGSGTWDFKPSLTYTGHSDDWSWGTQANGIVRMEKQNESGYRLGDMFQATAWGSYNFTDWLVASVRGVYTLQGGVDGQFTGSSGGQFAGANGQQSSILKFGPQDYPSNYGGKYWDVGFGLSAMVPSGDFAGNRFSLEWLQPVEDNVNGYQLDRDGSLSATWGIMF